MIYEHENLCLRIIFFTRVPQLVVTKHQMFLKYLQKNLILKLNDWNDLRFIFLFEFEFLR